MSATRRTGLAMSMTQSSILSAVTCNLPVLVWPCSTRSSKSIRSRNSFAVAWLSHKRIPTFHMFLYLLVQPSWKLRVRNQMLCRPVRPCVEYPARCASGMSRCDSAKTQLQFIMLSKHPRAPVLVTKAN